MSDYLTAQLDEWATERRRAASIYAHMRLLVDRLLMQGFDPERLEVKFSRVAWELLFSNGYLRALYPGGPLYRYRGIALRETSFMETGTVYPDPYFIVWYRS